MLPIISTISSPHLCLAVAALSAQLCQAQGTSQTPAPSPAADTQLQQVEVVGKQEAYDPRRDDTASKIVVTQEEIAKFGDTTLADVLKRQPGITVNGGNAGRGGGEIRMRGLGAGYTQILLNGEPAPPGFTLDSLSPNLIERIEIVRAASAEFSTQAIAGTINIVLKSKVLAAQREAKLTQAGSNSYASTALELQLSDKAQSLSYTLAASARAGRYNQHYQEAESATDGNSQALYRRQSSGFDQGHFANLTLTPRLNWALGANNTLSSSSVLSLSQSKGSNREDWAATLGGLPLNPIDRVQPQNRNDFARTDLNWVRKFADGAKFDAKLGLNASQRHSDYAEQTYNEAGVQQLDSNIGADVRERGLSFLGKYSQPMGDGHSVVLGWDSASTRRNESRVQVQQPLPGLLPVNSDERFAARLQRLALFAQDEWSLTPKLSVYLGARWEALHTTSAGNFFDAIQNRSSVWSPIAQVLWKLPESKNDQLRLALTRTYKAPGINRLIPRPYTSINNSAVAPDFQGNPALKPELATGLDLSYEHFFADGALLSASLYRRQVQDFTHNLVSLVGTRWLSMPVNDGRAQTQGLELEAKFPLQLFFKAAPAIDLRSNLALNRSRVDQVPGPNNRLTDQTPLSFNLGLDYKHSPSLTLGGNFSFKLGGPIRVSQVSSTYSSAKRELDMYALWKLGGPWQLRVSAVNLLAQPYSYIADYLSASGSLRNSTLYPASMGLRATLEWKLGASK